MQNNPPYPEPSAPPPNEAPNLYPSLYPSLPQQPQFNVPPYMPNYQNQPGVAPQQPPPFPQSSSVISPEFDEKPMPPDNQPPAYPVPLQHQGSIVQLPVSAPSGDFNIMTRLASAIRINFKRFKVKNLTKFEIRLDGDPNIQISGSENDNMLDGFSLKVLSLGIVNTRFGIKLYDIASNDPNKDVTSQKPLLTISRYVGLSDYIEVACPQNPEKQQIIGYIYPTGFTLNKITYNICNIHKQVMYKFESGMMRGLFSDGYSLVNLNRTNLGKLLRGSIELKHANSMDVGSKLLTLATGLIMTLH